MQSCVDAFQRANRRHRTSRAASPLPRRFLDTNKKRLQAGTAVLGNRTPRTSHRYTSLKDSERDIINLICKGKEK